MAEWLGQLLSDSPLWVIIIVGSIVALLSIITSAFIYGYDVKGPRSEWQKSWYKKKEVKKHGKK